MRFREGDRFRQRPREGFDQFRFDSSNNLGEEHDIPNPTNGFGCIRTCDNNLEHFVTRAEGAQDEIEHASIMQSLQDLIGGQQCLRVFQMGILYPSQ